MPRGRARSKIKLVKIITDAAMVDARHAEWLLERCHRSEFGRCTQVTGKDGQPIGGLQPVIHNLVVTEESEKLREIRSRFGKRPDVL